MCRVKTRAGVGDVIIFIVSFVWVWNLLDNTPLGMSAGAFLERLNRGGKTHPECGQYHAKDWEQELI